MSRAGQDRWDLLPEQARLLALLAAMIAAGALAEPSQGGDRGE